MKNIKEKLSTFNINTKKYNIIKNNNFYKSNSNSTKKFINVLSKKYLIILILSSILVYESSEINKLLFKTAKSNKYFIPNVFRLAFVFGTRPEAIKLFPLIKELKNNKNFICIIINTGQHKEMIQQILNSLNIDDYIDYNLNLMKKNQSLSELTSKSISEIGKLFNIIAPNAVIVQGDTTTAFSAAVSAFYLKIPIFHVEAGLRTHNLFYPFPEEFNRITIDDISTLYFAPTEWAASNLLKEYKNSSNIFVTGNTVVDSLQLTLNKTSPSKKINDLIKMTKFLCLPNNQCKIILLTCHRRENYYKPIYNILIAVQKLLEDFKDIVFIFPFHLNPNVRQSIKNAIPKEIYDDIIKGNEIKNEKYLYLKRLLIIPPQNYIDLIHLESLSYFIMSDSGGLQEEAIGLGKPILILRENTERPEAVNSGSAFLTGISIDKIYLHASTLLKDNDFYKNISKPKDIFGKGDSRIIISKIIQNYFKNNLSDSDITNNLDNNDILSKYDNSITNNYNQRINEYYDIVIILTVWKRNNIERQLIQVKNQSILKNKKTNLIIFQNANHVNIDDIVNKWKQPGIFSDNVDITFIHSPLETGYFGRFLVPLTSSVKEDTYFIICDDDIIWGNRYFENMIRVVNEGSLAVRTGRIIFQNFQELNIAFTVPGYHGQICFNEDLEHDFGGQVWAGRISWLRKAWKHIPSSIENSEDFWISAVLKTYYNITTKVPKCPCPEGNPVVPDMCAATDKTAAKHEEAIFGNSTAAHKKRKNFIIEITKKFNYTLLVYIKPNYVYSIHKKFIVGKNHFNLTDPLWKDTLLWQ